MALEQSLPSMMEFLSGTQHSQLSRLYQQNVLPKHTTTHSHDIGLCPNVWTEQTKLFLTANCSTDSKIDYLTSMLLLLLSTPLHQRAASRVQHPNHVAANSLSPQVARKGSTLSGFVQRSRLEREVGRDLHSN